MNVKIPQNNKRKSISSTILTQISKRRIQKTKKKLRYWKKTEKVLALKLIDKSKGSIRYCSTLTPKYFAHHREIDTQNKEQKKKQYLHEEHQKFGSNYAIFKPVSTITTNITYVTQTEFQFVLIMIIMLFLKISWIKIV